MCVNVNNIRKSIQDNERIECGKVNAILYFMYRISRLYNIFAFSLDSLLQNATTVKAWKLAENLYKDICHLSRVFSLKNICDHSYCISIPRISYERKCHNRNVKKTLLGNDKILRRWLIVACLLLTCTHFNMFVLENLIIFH